MHKKLFAGSLAVLMVLSMLACFAMPAAASSESHYFIYDIVDDSTNDSWNKVVAAVNKLSDTSKVTIHIEKDLSFSGYTLTQLENFNGVLDGHGHTFSNIQMSGSGTHSGSLIKCLGGTVQNLNLDSTCSFTNTCTTGNGAQTGAFAATTTAGAVIYNCSSSATVTAAKGDHLGGFVGNANNGVTIDSCLFRGTVHTAKYHASAMVGYHNFDGTLKIYNSIIMGSVSSDSGEGYTGAFRFNGERPFQKTERMPFYNSYVVGMNVAFYNGPALDYGLQVNGHAYNAETIERIYRKDDHAEAAWIVNNNHVDTGRAQVWFTLSSHTIASGGGSSLKFGSRDDRVVKMTVATENEIKVSYHARRKYILRSNNTEVLNQETVAPDVIEGKVAVVSGAEYRNGTIYIDHRDIAVTYITEAEHTFNQAQKKLQALVDAYEKMDPTLFTNWSAKQAWLNAAKNALENPNATANTLQAQITAESQLADGLVSMSYPNYPSISDYLTYQSINSIKDYAVSTKEEWLAAVEMSDHVNNPDAVDFSGITIHLTNTVDMEGEAMLPLCYGGVYDGNINGHDFTFENIKMEINAPYGPIGLIAQIQKSNNNKRSVQNLGIGSGSIKVTGSPAYKPEWGISDGGCKVGGIIGKAYANNFVIRKCWNNAEINAEIVDNVAGILADARNSVTIDSCFNIGKTNGHGISGYGQLSEKIFNSFSGATSNAALCFNPGIITSSAGVNTSTNPTENQLANYITQLKQYIKNVYSVNTALSFTHSPNAHQTAARNTFNTDSRVYSYAEAAWKINNSYVDSGLGDRVYFTLNEQGEVAFGTEANQIRRITLRCDGQEDQYAYGVPGQTVALSYGQEGAESEFYRYNYFALAETSTQASIKDNKLTLGNKDVVVKVEKNINRGDANRDGVMDLLDALDTIKSTVSDVVTVSVSAADVNNNGVLEVSDAYFIVREWMRGKNTYFTSGLPKETREDFIKVLSYNIKSFHFDPNAGNAYNNGVNMSKYTAVLNEMVALNADIIGLQEVDVNNSTSNWEDQLKKLATDLKAKTGKTYYTKFFLTVPRGNNGYGHGILSIYPILETGETHFAGIPQESGKRLDALEPRGFGWYQLDLNKNGRYDVDTDLMFYNCHLAESTQQQLTYMTDYMRKNHNGHRIVCTGDFNLSAWDMNGCFDTDYFTALNGSDNFDSYQATTVSTSTVDNIIVSDNVEHYWSMGQDRGIFTYYTDASDHLPVYTYVKKAPLDDNYDPYAEMKEDTSGTKIKIMSQNLRYNATSDQGTTNAISIRRHRFKKLVEKYDPDIICAQECDLPWITALQQDYGAEYTMFYHYRESTNSSNEATPVLWKTDKYTKLDDGYFWLSETPNVSSPSYVNGYLPRIVNWVSLKDKETGVKFNIYSTHLGFDYTTAHLEAIQEQFIAEFNKNQDAYCFLMGDFNFSYGSNAYYKIIDGQNITDLRLVAEAMTKNGHCEFGELRQGTSNAFVYDNGDNNIDFICAAPRKNMAIDYYTVCYEKYGVEPNIPVGFVSDHFALYTEVRIDTDLFYGEYYADSAK